MAIHTCLTTEKYCKSEIGVKGNTVLIFDKEECEADDFIELVKNPPEWTDTYYSREHRQVRLDQIIDVPYFTDSRHVGLIQLEDAETGEIILIDSSSLNMRKKYDNLSNEERHNNRKLFKSLGIDLIEIETDKPYIQNLLNFFRLRGKRL